MKTVSRALSTLVLLTALVSGLARAEGVPKPLSQEWADDPPPVEESCELYNERYAMAPLFRVAAKPGERVNLFARKQACPEGARCPHRRQTYLVAGDVALAGPEDRGFRCVYFGTRRGALVAGFVPAKNLTPAEAETKLERAFLLGSWRRDETSRVRIRPNGAAGLEVDGTGHYRGVGGVNEGQFSARAAAVTSPLVLRDEESAGCIVVVERRGPYLLLNDNAGCGGHNVRFVGIYVREGRR